MKPIILDLKLMYPTGIVIYNCINYFSRSLLSDRKLLLLLICFTHSLTSKVVYSNTSRSIIIHHMNSHKYFLMLKLTVLKQKDKVNLCTCVSLNMNGSFHPLQSPAKQSFADINASY